MKKLLFVALLVALCICGCKCVAFATTNTEAEIEQLALQNEKVTKAKCIIYQRYCVIAIKTEKFVTQSDYHDYTENLEKLIKGKYQVDNVVITRSPKVMCQIEQLANMDEAQRRIAIETLLQTLQHKHHLPPIKQN